MAHPTEAPPYPTLIEYSGYGYANPAGPVNGIAVLANLMGFAVVDVNMRGTGCSGGAYDFFETLQNLDAYDVIETIAHQPWVLGHKVGMMGVYAQRLARLGFVVLLSAELCWRERTRGPQGPGRRRRMAGVLGEGALPRWRARGVLGGLIGQGSVGEGGIVDRGRVGSVVGVDDGRGGGEVLLQPSGRAVRPVVRKRRRMRRESMRVRMLDVLLCAQGVQVIEMQARADAEKCVARSVTAGVDYWRW